jgi:hypothetical protein
VSKIYAIAKAFFSKKSQFSVFEESLPAEPAKIIPKQEEQKPAPKAEETTEEKLKQEEVSLEEKPAKAPVVQLRPRVRRLLE